MTSEKIKREVIVRLPGREEATLQIEISADGIIENASLKGIGGPEFLAALCELRRQLTGPLNDLAVPQGTTPADILLRELVLRAKGEWDYPYKEDELCHCRVVPTALVDAAIVCGAHTTREVSAQTSASTACGTCRPNVEAMIRYRLGCGNAPVAK